MAKNEVIIEGRLGQDPKVGTSQSGKMWAKFSIAVWQGKDKKPLWLNCGCTGDVAEQVGNTLKKGSTVTVKGKLNLNEWQGKETIEVFVFSLGDEPKKSGADAFGEEVPY